MKRMKVQLTSDGAYRPETLVINGEFASMKLYSEKHGYNWKSTASGNVLYYRTESGSEYQIKQSELMKKGNI